MLSLASALESYSDHSISSRYIINDTCVIQIDTSNVIISGNGVSFNTNLYLITTSNNDDQNILIKNISVELSETEILGRGTSLWQTHYKQLSTRVLYRGYFPEQFTKKDHIRCVFSINIYSKNGTSTPQRIEVNIPKYKVKYISPLYIKTSADDMVEITPSYIATQTESIDKARDIIHGITINYRGEEKTLDELTHNGECNYTYGVYLFDFIDLIDLSYISFKMQ